MTGLKHSRGGDLGIHCMLGLRARPKPKLQSLSKGGTSPKSERSSRAKGYRQRPSRAPPSTCGQERTRRALGASAPRLHPPRSPRRGQESACCGAVSPGRAARTPTARSPLGAGRGAGASSRPWGNRGPRPPPAPNPARSAQGKETLATSGRRSPPARARGRREPKGQRGAPALAHPGAAPARPAPPARSRGCPAPAPARLRRHRPPATHCCTPRPRTICAPRSAGSCPRAAGPAPARAARAGAARRAAPAPQPCCGHRGGAGGTEAEARPGGRRQAGPRAERGGRGARRGGAVPEAAAFPADTSAPPRRGAATLCLARSSVLRPRRQPSRLPCMARSLRGQPSVPLQSSLTPFCDLGAPIPPAQYGVLFWYLLAASHFWSSPNQPTATLPPILGLVLPFPNYQIPPTSCRY